MNRITLLLMSVLLMAALLSACAVTVTPAQVQVRPAAVTVTASGQRVASSQDMCKRYGWRSLVRQGGSSFRNQGACQSYVRTGR